MEVVLDKYIYDLYMAVIYPEPINSYSYMGTDYAYTYTYTGQDYSYSYINTPLSNYYTKAEINSKINSVNTKYNTLLSRYNKLKKDIDDINSRLDKLKDI